MGERIGVLTEPVAWFAVLVGLGLACVVVWQDATAEPKNSGTAPVFIKTDQGWEQPNRNANSAPWRPFFRRPPNPPLALAAMLCCLAGGQTLIWLRVRFSAQWIWFGGLAAVCLVWTWAESSDFTRFWNTTFQMELLGDPIMLFTPACVISAAVQLRGQSLSRYQALTLGLLGVLLIWPWAFGFLFGFALPAGWVWI